MKSILELLMILVIFAGAPCGLWLWLNVIKPSKWYRKRQLNKLNKKKNGRT